MKKISWLYVAVITFSSIASAQEKLLTVDEIFSPDPKVKVRFGGSPAVIQWTRDGKAFKQVQNGSLMRVDAASGQASVLLDGKRLASALMSAGIKAQDAERLAASPALQFNPAETAVLINHQGDLWFYDISAGTLKRLTNNKDEEKEADFSPDGKWVSFVRGNNLFVADPARGGEKQLTRDGSAKIYNGYLDWIYEEELYGRGQNRGYWWSPDSKYLAFLRLDETPVPKFVLPDDTVTDQRVENTDYPQAGDPNPRVQLGIAGVDKTSAIPNVGGIPRIGNRIPGNILRFGDLAKFVDLKKYRADELLIGRVAWTPDSSKVIYQALDREQTYLDVNVGSLDGKTTNLFTETTPAWVEVFGNPGFLRDGRAVWQSARNGWKHLYLYDNTGKMLRQLTAGKWEVRTFYGIDEAGGWAYFSAGKDSHIGDNVYRVRLDGSGDVERLTRGEGWHAAAFNSTFTYFTDTWSDINTPQQTRLYRADGTLVRAVNENKVPILSDYKLGRSEFLKVNTRDGFEMEALMIKPPDFDPYKKYPVLIYTYAGVHSPLVANRFNAARNMWHQMMAQKGYIIWVCDNRTASGKGQESAWPAYKNLGPLELRDIEDGVTYLRSMPYVDSSRIGIWGWSNGGFMTAYALTHSRSFKMGIAGGTVSDWRLYDSIFTERVMMTPKNNPEGYERSSVLNAAGNLSGRLLLIHGGMDNNVHPQNTIQLAYKLQKANKQFDLMIYPTQRHGITDPEQNLHFYNLMTEYILKNL
jgi:dipeptidyl-peptidase-4